MLSSIIMHTLWKSRNDKKHRQEPAPHVEALLHITTSTFKENVKAALYLTEDDEELQLNIKAAISTLALET